MVTVLFAVGMERIVLGGNCCGVWVWNGLCWMVTVLLGVGLERIVLDGNFAVGCGSGTDCVGW
jgi:hypothetical protein